MKTNIGLSSVMLCIFVFMNYSCKEDYHIEKSYNAKKRYSIVQLYSGKAKMDSIYLFDYYDNLQINRKGNNSWFLYYNGPGGSGVSTGNSLLLNVVNKKIKIPIFINSVNKSYENEQILMKDSLALNFKNDGLAITSFKKKNEKLLSSKVFFANYNEEKHLFYNGKINLKKDTKISIFDFKDMKFKFSELSKNGEYPSLKIDDNTYLYYNNYLFWLKNDNEVVNVF